MAELDRLLRDAKSTVEGLLSMPTANVWSIYGGLKRLSLCLENILNHGLKYSHLPNQSSTLDYSRFIKSLQWLNPVLAPSAEKIRKISIEEDISEGKAWVRHSLRSHTMLAQLKTLVSDEQNLHRFYNDDAFLCNHDYFQALCVCLEAVDKNQSSLLTNIDHSLISRGRSSTSSSSSPYTPRSRTHTQPTDPLTQELTSSTVSLRSKTEPAMTPAKKWAESSRMSQDSVTLDNILNNEEKTHNSNTHPTNQKKVSKGKQPMKGHQRSKSELGFSKGQHKLKSAPVQQSVDSVDGAVFSSSLPDKNSSMAHRLHNVSRGGTFSQGFLTQPSPGESLKSYLSSQDFDTCAELDRENAHFAISEALIAAIEYMKWNQVLRPAEPPLLENLSQLEDSELESDEEIVKLKQRIKEKKKQRFMKKHGLASEKSSSGATPKSSSHSNSIRDSDSMFSEEDEYNSSAPSDTDSLLTLRDGLLFTDRLSDSGLSSNINPSADQVALSLLSQFNEYHLPKADELVWLVSEKEAPQALLPLPDSLPISPDDMMEGRKGTRIRGNADWAPPRPQIIFNIHPNPGRKILISKQNYRCAGCGMKIEQGYLKRFRYCEYLGKYFCHCCHTNNLSIIPARILHKWDFTKYPVSKFSFDLIERMAADPLFNVLDISISLLQKVKTLQRITRSRLQLRFSKNFLTSCRLATEFYEKMLAVPSYMLDDVHLYSINDLLSAKSKVLDRELQEVAKSVISHILDCPLCMAKGFICEICNNSKDILFPFQFDKVVRCNHCHSCYHNNCYNKRNKNCPKCERIESRKLKSMAASEQTNVDIPE